MDCVYPPAVDSLHLNQKENTPKKIKKGPNDLTLCRVFRHNTCCDVTQTYPALISVRKLASTGEGSADCLHLWELLECSICDPRVGTRPGPPLICESFCGMVFEACSNAYFSLDLKTQVLSPCGLNDIVCGKLNKWVANGTELCLITGFSVQPASEISDASSPPVCYGSKAGLESIADSWRNSNSKDSGERKNDRLKFKYNWTARDFRQWLANMPLSERISWAIGGMVLTTGIIYISKRKNYNQRQRQAAVRTVRRNIKYSGN